MLALAGIAGLAVRLATGSPYARAAVRLHVMLGLMIAAYLIGFAVRGDFSRTLIRVPMAIGASVLACELLRTRRHVRLAVMAIIAAAVIEAAYGLLFVAAGRPLHPTRFSGMMGVNFTAMMVLVGAVMALALMARTRQPLKLLIPLALGGLAAATLSRTGLLAMLIAGSLVLWAVAAPFTRRVVAGAAIAAMLLVATQDRLREQVLARASAEIEQDGVGRTSADVRMHIMRSAWAALADRPVVGIGYFGFQSYSTRDPEIERSTFGVGYATHNTYLEILVEGGMLALLPFLLHFAGYLEPLRRMLPAMLERRDVVAAAALAGFLVVLVTASAANVLVHYLFWSIAGIALACARAMLYGDHEPGAISA
jgi:O-antigen ligase